ncbi:YeeE/YedE family protein [Spirochaeta cellobiosiphila]|uniref:YeeE/YedE family protein n=1 Tax=Spirochaeta cellobiosiphila TaxID=504483 RepID=UPI000422EDC1|nr:YeeE/YedE thiosulfate transporter family protein [Spirochaeta cellobiosiphila]
MIEWLSQPWPWYVSGPLIGLMVPLLLFLGNKQFGISSSLRHLCAISLPHKPEYLRYNWREYSWNLALVLGVIVGALLAVILLKGNQTPDISLKTKEMLLNWNITDIKGLSPISVFGLDQIVHLKNLILIIGGGFLVGFGTRYAGGCTSGHAIMGLSLLNFGSLVAVIGFFIGGLLMSHIILPMILGL